MTSLWCFTGNEVIWRAASFGEGSRLFNAPRCVQDDGVTWNVSPTLASRNGPCRLYVRYWIYQCSPIALSLNSCWHNRPDGDPSLIGPILTLCTTCYEINLRERQGPPSILRPNMACGLGDRLMLNRQQITAKLSPKSFNSLLALVPQAPSGIRRHDTPSLGIDLVIP